MAIPSAAPYAQPRRRTRLPHEGLKTQVLSGMLEKKAGNTRQKASEYLRLGTLSSQQVSTDVLIYPAIPTELFLEAQRKYSSKLIH